MFTKISEIKLKNVILIVFLFLNILNFNAQDSTNIAKKNKITKTVFTKKDIKVDQDSIKKLVFEPNFKFRYKNKAFNYEKNPSQKNIWQSFKEWLSNWLSKYFDFGNGENSIKFVSYLINFIAIAIIIFVLYLIVKSFLNKEGQWIFGKNSDKKMIRYDDVEKNLKLINFQTLIQDAIAAGNKRFAIRYYYLWVLKKMSENEIIEWDLEKTNSDYLNEIKNTSDKENFAYLSYLYNYIWYGDFEMDNFDFEKAISAFKKTIQSLQ